MAIAISGGSDGNNIAGTSSKVSSENKKNAGEMLGGCSVCPSDQGTDENPLVYCDGCELAVHSACYGIVNVPKGDWFCGKCESGNRQNKLKCELCPSHDGALKKTETGQWAHVVCALYIPEVRFGNNNTMEPIEIRHIPADRYNKRCYLCEDGGNSTMADYGAVMDCNEPGCKQSFHVTCGQAASLLCEKPGKDSDILIYIGYCEHHFRKMKAGNRKSTNNSLNKSSSSYLDSAGDSSQDNDPRCNIAGQDKSLNQTVKTSTMPNLQISSASNQVETSAASQDVYKWSSSNKDEMNEKEKTPINGKTSSKKKPATNTQLSPTKQLPATTTTLATTITTTTADPQLSLATTNYNTNKIVSPNFSSSTSTSSSSSNSTTTPSSSSSSSTSSNSPSPAALVSPNISNRKSTSAVRTESPLASNLKTGTNNELHNKASLDSNTSSVARPLQGQNSIQTRINLDSLKKNPLASSSLLSTAVPIPQELTTNPTTGSSTSASSSTAPLLSTTLSSSTSESNNLSGNSFKNSLPTLSGQANDVFDGNTQPIVPPLIIPVPPPTTSSAANPTTKPTAKAKTVKATRKKPNETTESSKPEPKPKASRAKKAPAGAAAAAANASTSNSNNGESTPKPEPKKGRSKAAAKPAATSSVSPPNSAVEATTTAPTTKAKAIAPTKRKSRASSSETATTAATPSVAPSPAKRPRKKKADQQPKASGQLSVTGPSSSQPLSATNAAPLSAATNPQVGTSPLLINTPNAGSNRLLQVLNSGDGQDMSNRYFSPMISPYANFDHLSAPSLTRSSLSRLFTSSSVNNNNSSNSNNNNQTNLADDPAKAFEELRENTWSHLSKCVLEQAQQFDIPSLIGTLYTLRSENEKLVNKVRDLTMKRDQLIAMNARLDLPGPMLTQHLNNTSPNFSSAISGLSNSPKSLPTPSPGSTIGKAPHISVGPFNHVPPGSLCPGYLDRSSPLVSQTHSGLNNIKSSSISTPSPPIGALMAHSTSNRAGLISANQPFMPNVFPAMNTTLSQLGSQGSSYYPRQ